jgi:hypothetical protein
VAGSPRVRVHCRRHGQWKRACPDCNAQAEAVLQRPRRCSRCEERKPLGAFLRPDGFKKYGPAHAFAAWCSDCRLELAEVRGPGRGYGGLGRGWRRGGPPEPDVWTPHTLRELAAKYQSLHDRLIGNGAPAAIIQRAIAAQVVEDVERVLQHQVAGNGYLAAAGR